MKSLQSHEYGFSWVMKVTYILELYISWPLKRQLQPSMSFTGDESSNGPWNSHEGKIKNPWKCPTHTSTKEDVNALEKYCTLIREVFRDCIRRRRRHTFASLWGACLRCASLWRTNSRRDSCVLGVHPSNVCWALLNKTHKNFVNLFRGNSQDFHALFTRFSWPKLRVFLWVHRLKIPLKKPWKYWKIHN